MSKLPFMKFFPDNWLADCQVLSLAGRGAWQTIICKAWHPSTRGIVTLKLPALARLFGATIEQTERVIAELEESGVGDITHEGDTVTITCRRVVREWDERDKERTFLSQSGKKGASKRWGGHSPPNSPPNREAIGGANGEANSPPYGSPEARSQSPDNSIERGNPRKRGSEAEIPTWEAVRSYALGTIGLAEWKARDWFDEMEGGGWLDYSHRPIQNWKAVLNRVKTKWEADGRPKTPPTSRVGSGGGFNQQQPAPSTKRVSKWADQIKPTTQEQ
jgi:hypothetical protein